MQGRLRRGAKMATVISIKDVQVPVSTMHIRTNVQVGKNQILRNVGLFSQNFNGSKTSSVQLLVKANEELTIASELGEIKALLVQVNGEANLKFLAYKGDESVDCILNISQLVILENVKDVTITANNDTEVLYVAVA